MIRGLDRLVGVVQRNCDIADARHAGDLTLCTYLLEMREFYRWERGIAFTEELPRAEVGEWLVRREALWKSLEGRSFEPVPVEASRFDPFAADEINVALVPRGLIYSAGYGRRGRAQFHLGELVRKEHRGTLRVLIGGREHARDLGSSPAALRGATAYVRQESFRRWLWEKFETWSARRPEGALSATLAAYGFDGEPLAGLERMVDAETETLILHELGEFEASRELGANWEEMVAKLGTPRVEAVLRALRDNLADCLVTLPALLDRDAAPSVHFWFATFDGLRSEIFPRLGGAYRPWCGGEPGPLRDALAAGCEHWERVCRGLLAIDRDRPGAEQAIAELAASPAIRL